MLLAIETSCDETAVSVFDIDAYHGGKCANECLLFEEISSQAELHATYGGVVPELAAREHLVNLPVLFKRALESTTKGISSIAVTQGPGLKGCLLVGVSFAKSFAYRNAIPLIPVHHIEAHLMSALLSNPHFLDGTPTVALVVSGGHTELYSIAGFRRYTRLAKTLDDAAGEAFDKSATLLGLPYPGGPRLAELAKQSTGQKETLAKYKISEGVPHQDSAFSFSGLKTDVSRVVKEARLNADSAPTWQADIAAACQDAIVNSLVRKSLVAVRQIQAKRFLLCGGVAANEHLRTELTRDLAAIACELITPSRFHCTDNASMVAVCAAEALRTFGRAPFDLLQTPSLSHLAARPRFPLVDLLTAGEAHIP